MVGSLRLSDVSKVNLLFGLGAWLIVCFSRREGLIVRGCTLACLGVVLLVIDDPVSLPDGIALVVTTWVTSFEKNFSSRYGKPLVKRFIPHNRG